MLQHWPGEILRGKSPPHDRLAEKHSNADTNLKAGFYCVTGGCCKNGKTCTDGSGSSIFSNGDDDDDDDDEVNNGASPTTTSGNSGNTAPGATTIVQGSKNIGGTNSASLGLMLAVAIAVHVPVLQNLVSI